jgi:hypothetical protein
LGGQVSKGEPLRYYREVVLSYEGDDCLIWPYGKSKGYGHLNATDRTGIVARRVLEDKIGPAPSALHDAAHSCGWGAHGCVNPRHLRWATKIENMRDQYAHGTRVRGERHGNAKLTSSDVAAIRAMKGKALQREIADRFGVSREQIRDIQNGKNWGWLTS